MADTPELVARLRDILSDFDAGCAADMAAGLILDLDDAEVSVPREMAFEILSTLERLSSPAGEIELETTAKQRSSLRGMVGSPDAVLSVRNGFLLRLLNDADKAARLHAEVTRLTDALRRLDKLEGMGGLGKSIIRAGLHKGEVS